MWDEKILPAILGGAFGIVGSFIGFACWPALRRWSIRRNLDVVVSKTPAPGLWCRVVNGSNFTLGKALVYVTIDHALDDIWTPPAGQKAYVHPDHQALVDQCQICWAVQESGKNPMKIDVCAGEHQPLSLGMIQGGLVQLYSEQADNPSRVFLSGSRVYTGRLKVVSLDCRAKEFAIRIDPAASQPLTISPAV